MNILQGLNTVSYTHLKDFSKIIKIFDDGTEVKFND